MPAIWQAHSWKASVTGYTISLVHGLKTSKEPLLITLSLSFTHPRSLLLIHVCAEPIWTTGWFSLGLCNRISPLSACVLQEAELPPNFKGPQSVFCFYQPKKLLSTSSPKGLHLPNPEEIRKTITWPPIIIRHIPISENVLLSQLLGVHWGRLCKFLPVWIRKLNHSFPLVLRYRKRKKYKGFPSLPGEVGSIGFPVLHGKANHPYLHLLWFWV